MPTRILTSMAVLAAGVWLTSAFVTAQAPAAARTNAAGWTPPLTSYGHPDIQGVYSNATYTPFERPKEYADREFFTPDEAAAYAKQRLDALHDQPQDTHYEDAIWMTEKQPRGMTSLRTSIIVEPRNGRLPAMTEEGRARQAARAAARKAAGGQFDSAQSRSLSERCIIWQHEGPPILPTGYNSNLQIMQGPNHVVIMHEMMRDPRVIPLDGRPHVGEALRAYRGDSRGRWEGHTLVVETTNFSDKTAFRGASEHQKVIERFTPVDPETVLYQFTVEDPRTWETPWSGEVPLKKSQDKLYEYACHEGNYGIAHILSAQRVAEAEAAAAGR